MMPLARPASTERGLEVPVRRFARHQAAEEAMVGYQAALREDAARRRSRGSTVKDQDHRDEVFCLLPARPALDARPLVIVGGMGPLAGAMAFRRACARFEDSRAVVLYQACSVPDRSTVILGEGRLDTPACRRVASRLASAVRLAVGLAPAGHRPARCILACNSAHYFWPLVLEQLRRPRPCPVEMISLVESAAEALRRLACRSALILATEGARAGQVFSAPFRAAGIPFDEPSPPLSLLLMRAVFEGVKALDERRALELGDELFEAVARSGRGYDCVLAGCTELPIAVALLRLRGRPAVRTFLSRVKVVDPLEEALGHA
jgi:aspartate racemase